MGKNTAKLTAKNLEKFLTSKNSPERQKNPKRLLTTYGVPRRVKPKQDEMDKVSVTSCLDGYAFSENLGD